MQLNVRFVMGRTGDLSSHTDDLERNATDLRWNWKAPHTRGLLLTDVEISSAALLRPREEQVAAVQLTATCRRDLCRVCCYLCAVGYRVVGPPTPLLNVVSLSLELGQLCC